MNDPTAASNTAKLAAIETIAALLASTPPAVLGERLAEHLRQHSGARAVLIGSVSDPGSDGAIIAASPAPAAGMFTPAELKLICDAEPAAPPPVASNAFSVAERLREPLLRIGIETFLCFPLVACGEAIGVLMLLDFSPVGRVDEVRDVMSAIVPMLALAVRGIKAHRRGEQLARNFERQTRELEAAVAARTSELAGLTRSQTEANLAVLNMMEDAVAARGRAELALAELQQEMATRRQAEEALRASEQYYRLLFENNPLPLWVYDRATLAFLAVNAAAISHYGYSREEFLGMTVREIRPVEDVPALHARIATVGREIARPTEWRHRKKDGTIISVEITSHPLEFAGRDARLVLAHDVTERKRAEAALKERTRYIETVLENAPIGFAVNTIDDGTARFVSTRFEQIYGVPRGSIQSVNDFFAHVYRDPVFREQMRARTMSDIASGDAARMRWENLPLPQEDGTKRYITAINIPVPDQNVMVSTVQDVTDRVLAQQALTRDEVELAAIYEHAPVMLLLIDREQQIRRVNRAALDYAIQTTNGAIGKTTGETLGCLHALDDPRGCGFGAACVACPLRQAVLDSLHTGAIHRRVEAETHLIRGQDVVDATVLVSSARIQVENEPMVLLCIEDVSQQKLAEQRIREQAALLDVTRDAILVVDLDGRVTYWNHGAEQLYGWPADEAIGQDLAALVFDRTPSDLEAALRAIRDAGQWNGEWRQRTRDGQALVTAGRGVLMTDSSGEARSMLLTASDVTEAKRLEAQFLRAQRLDTLGSLASGVAHDLNNVFTPIMISVDMLESLARDPADVDLVRMLQESARRGAGIVHQLLMFGRGSEAPRRTIEIASVVAEVARLVQQTFPKNVVLTTAIPAGLWHVHADPTQLHQVLLNLCVNARDAMPQGGRLTVSVENREVDAALARDNLDAQPGPHVVIRVSDSGTGISSEFIDKIFDPFFTTKPVGQGTGLGLATVLSITRGHGGFVTVKSEVGAGTEFGIHLPAIVEIEPRAEGTRAALSASHGELILVVDDEAAIRQMLLRALRQHGYAVMLAADGKAAAELFAAHASDIRLVLTDIMMPGVDGFEVIRSVRGLDGHVPILAISGIRSHRAEIERIGAPAVRFMAKPFALEDLVPVIREMLDTAARNAADRRA